MKKLILIIALFIILQLTLQQVTYESLKKQAQNIEDEDLTLEHDASEKIEEKIVSPAVVSGFWCDKDIKLNSVRQDVMNNNNYNKYSELT
jgi:hypothetical protein